MQVSDNTVIKNIPGLWQPHSWRNHEAQQQPLWDNQEGLLAVVEQLSRLPGLVGASEIETLKHQIAEAGFGRRFILQGGDCAERFQDCREDVIRGKLQILMQMALVMAFAGRRPIVPIGRMAGQYAKPRSDNFETSRDGNLIPIFRGESVNSFGASVQSRRADPLRLLQAYHSSSATLNFIRLLMGSGFGDFNHMDQWDLTSSPTGAHGRRYEQIASGLKDTLDFVANCTNGETPNQARALGFREFFVSHEALLLPYEEALTRFVPEMGRYYNLSTHMVWIGDRTRMIDGAHVEYCRGIGNPVGIKIGADAEASELIELISRINPHNEVGKVTLITRLGAQNVKCRLGQLISAVAASGHSVTWSVDPMHGNTTKLEDGRKTRRFEDITSEVRDTFAAHKEAGSILGGIHLEMTADDVTECTGGSSGVTDRGLARRYETWCDPRLNGSQSLEMAFAVSACLRTTAKENLN